MALIKEAIIEPSKGLSRYGQEGVIVKLKDGKQIQGVARNRDNYSMQVLDAKGDLHLISMLNVDQLTISANSPMPGDYGQRLSKQELQDLVAYLAHQTVRPLAPAGRKP
jgi:putative heme-binding domain-containing protein